MFEQLSRAYTSFVRSKGKPPRTLRVGVKEANEIIHLVAECYPNCDYEFGFNLIKRSFKVKPVIVLKESLIEFK